jgi:hypothetical protein
MSSGTALYVDIDKTLIYPFTSREEEAAYTGSDAVEIGGRKFRRLDKNIYLVERFHANCGMDIVFWSAGGGAWAYQVCAALCLTHMSKHFLTKPTWYLDDLPYAGIDAREDGWIDAKHNWPEG